MRIISKQHDYYDIGMGLGHDDSIVYVREPKDVAEGRQYNDEIQSILVGFCGRCYPGFRLTHREGDNVHRSICYTIEDVDRFARQHLTEKAFERYIDKSPSRWSLRMRRYYESGSYLGSPSWNRYALQALLERRKNDTNQKPHKLFSEHNCPIFVVDGKTVVNCLLKPYEFYKVFDPYTAYQELSMYVGGVLLAPVNPVPSISDETMRDIKGFDKWSFRKEPKS